MSGRVLIGFTCSRVHAVLVQAAKRSKARFSERMRLLCEAAAEERDA